jgi:hypothetical protein
MKRVLAMLLPLPFPFLLVATVAQAQVGLATFSSPAGVSGYIAILDLGSGAFKPVTTALDKDCRSQGNGQVSLLNTGNFAQNQATVLAITANSGPGGVTGCGTPAGLLISQGLLVNPGQTAGPVLYFHSATQAGITGGLVPDGLQWAVAGSTNTNNDCPNLYQPGTLLVQNGLPGACAIPKSMARAGRGAAGLDSTGRYLIVVVAQGTDSGGLLTSELSQIFVALHAVSAVNFDGGGSTAFYWTPPAVGPPPTVDATAQKMIMSAKFPPALQLTVTQFLPSMKEVYDSEDRAVYASLGFTFTPRPAAAAPPK